jgi:MoxR-like ATPase
VGTRIYKPGAERFDTELGPVFCNFLLADEINRAPAKVQSALLEVMQERQVTIGEVTHPVPAPFLVMATQNPIESDGTYPLPEAQVDRFLLKVVVGYPEVGEEVTVVERAIAGDPVVRQILSPEELLWFQQVAQAVYVDPALARYTVDLAAGTRHLEQIGLDDLSGFVAYGASPRGPISLVHSARALALLRGRSYALPQDIKDLAPDVLRHRLVLTYRALAEEVTPDTIIERVLAVVPSPKIELARESA